MSTRVRLSPAKKAARVVPPKLKTARARTAAIRRATSRVRTTAAINVRRVTRT